MPTVQELYELWAADSEVSHDLTRSLEPRGAESLFAALGPKAGQLVADIGSRDGLHAIRLVRTHELRAVAIDVVHVDARRSLAERHA